MAKKIKIIRKIVLLGDPSVGKTSLVRKYVLDDFSDDYIATIGTKVTSKKMTYTNPEDKCEIELTLMIWDIMGQEEANAIPKNVYEGSKGAIMVCDLTRKETLYSLSRLTTRLIKASPNIQIIFAANKNDLTDQLQFGFADMSHLSDEFNSPHFLTSAKSGENVESAFHKLGKMMLKMQGVMV